MKSKWVVCRTCKGEGSTDEQTCVTCAGRRVINPKELQQRRQDELDQALRNARYETAYKNARHEHAFLLRCEGLIYSEIGQRLGITGSRARELVGRFGFETRRMFARCKVYFVDDKKSTQRTRKRLQKWNEVQIEKRRLKRQELEEELRAAERAWAHERMRLKKQNRSKRA